MLRLDYPGGFLKMNLGYASPPKTTAHLGIDAGLSVGFKGDVKEFFMSFGAIDDDKIINLINMVKVFDVSTMAYYRFQSENGVLRDWMRDQQAKLVIGSRPKIERTDQKSKEEAYLYVEPKFMNEQATESFCNTLPSQLMPVAQFQQFKSKMSAENVVFD